MFVGHFGAGMIAKKIDSRPSLGTIFIAAQFIDLLWPFLVFFGVEKVQIEPGNTAFTPLNFVYYPFSHSLFGVAVWAILFGGIYFLIKRNFKSALILAALVLSHWFLDLLTHRPDLPLVPWSDVKVGLGLWNSIPFTIIVELSIFLLGAYLYFKSTKAKNKIGSIALWSLLAFFIVVYFMNIFNPPPPSSQAIALAGFSMWIFIAWAYWIDKNREIIK